MIIQCIPISCFQSFHPIFLYSFSYLSNGSIYVPPVSPPAPFNFFNNLNFKRNHFTHTFIKVVRKHATLTIFRRMPKSIFVPLYMFILQHVSPTRCKQQRCSMTSESNGAKWEYTILCSFCNRTKNFIRELKIIFKLASFIIETVNSAITSIPICFVNFLKFIITRNNICNLNLADNITRGSFIFIFIILKTTFLRVHQLI